MSKSSLIRVLPNFRNLVAFFASFLFLCNAHAASIIDEATKASILVGFTNMKDTMLDIMGTAFPFIVAGAVIMASPRIVTFLIHLASGRR